MAWPNYQFHIAAMRTLEASADRWATLRADATRSCTPFLKSGRDPDSEKPRQGGVAFLHVYLESLPSPMGKDAEAYLLSLARSNDATFVTVDTRLKHMVWAETRIKIPGS